MTGYPQILLIDDLSAWDLGHRADICSLFKLRDTSSDAIGDTSSEDKVAEIVVCSGQEERDGTRFNSLAACERAVERGWPGWTLVLLDLRFVSGRLVDGRPAGGPGDSDDHFGMLVLDHLHKKYPDLPVVILSSRDRSAHLDELSRRGALDFIPVTGVLQGTSATGADLLRDRLHKHGLLWDSRGIIAGRSLALIKCLKAARQAAVGRSTLLLGESGTGKELLARYIHEHSPREGGPYVTRSLLRPRDLVSDDLFGHERGAFTGANDRRIGAFEEAHGGTLFLDEFAEIDLATQAALLRVIEDRTVRRQGGERDIPVDLHLVFATNRDLDACVRDGLFRKDLLERIKAFPILIPPLRDRREDIVEISSVLVTDICRRHRCSPRDIDEAALAWLGEHPWPQNVRELRNVIEQAVLRHPDAERLHLAHLPAEQRPVVPPRASGRLDPMPVPTLEEQWNTHASVAGKLAEVEYEARLRICKYLVRCDEFSRNASGSINLSRLVALSTGLDQVTHGDAASLIKRLLLAPRKLQERIFQQLPQAQAIWEVALQTRKSSRLPKL